MAQRRMFSPKITSSDAFLEMPTSSQALYFHLGMHADDDGFVNPKFVIRTCGAKDDDLNVLLAKRFVLPFENGVIVIKHWKINNLIKSDRYTPTIYTEQKERLTTKDNGSYTERFQNGSKMVPQVRLGKDRLLDAKLRVEPEQKKEKKVTPEMQQVFDLFSFNPARLVWKGRVHQRDAAQVLYNAFGMEELKKRLDISQKYRKDPLCPKIDNPADFLEKMPKMETFLQNL